MREKGVPIDGVGLQMHVSCNWTPNYEQLTKLISQYEEIGVEVHITEIDVKRTQCKSAEAQKEVFMNVFKACFDHENCKVFTVWGSYDEESWVGVENEPVLFDVDMYPKDIYFDMLDYVLEKLPADATYPVPTNTERPTKSTSDTEVAGATYIIKPESYMIDPAWSNWSWGWASVDVNDDGSVVAVLEEDKYGAFSLHTGKKFGAGKIHVELKSDKEGFPVKIIVHSTDDEQIVIKTIDDAYSEELKAYDVEVPAGTYDRISIQDAWGKALAITMNNYYYVPAGTETDEPAPTTAPETPDTPDTPDTPSTPTTPASDKASYVVKPGSSQIESPWANWSWGYESVDFDEEGNVVAVFEEEKYGAFSVHTDKDFNAGIIHVELKSDKAGVPVTIVVHTSADDEFTTLYKIDDSSSDELKAYDVEVPALEGDNYNRITIQDAWGKAITLTINNFYFTPAEPAESTEPTEPVATEGDRYDIVKEGKLDDKWQNWSWGYETIDFDEEGNAVVVFEEAKYGGLSLYTDKVFNAGTIHVELKSDKAGAPVTIAVHTSADDEFNAIYKIDDASSDELKAYDIEVPAIEGDNYNRITIQDAWGKAITLTINNFYFTPAKSTEPTEPTEPVATEGERYDIVKEGELDGKWQNWSWGIDSTEVDEEGNFVNHITAGSWGAVSFKRSDGVEFGAGTLYFKAKVNDTRANLQILFHSSTDDDDYVNMGNYKDISDSEMTQYQVEVTAPEGKKYDRITIQDVFNQGITLYLNDVYFVATPKTEEPIDENCWASALGFNCCKTTKTVVFEDQDGSWGVEDDFWCGIVEDKEETCWSTKLGYPCCEVSNAIYSVDDNGSWGYENDHWCGLLKKNEECKFSGLGYTCCPDSEVIFEDDHKWGATSDGQWCGVAF